MYICIRVCVCACICMYKTSNKAKLSYIGLILFSLKLCEQDRLCWAGYGHTVAMKRDTVSDPVSSSVASDLADLCNSDARKSWNTFKAAWLRGVPRTGECTKI